MQLARRQDGSSVATVRVAALLVAVLLTAACEKPEYERPPRDEQVAQADSMLTMEAFDTLTWASDAERAEAGNNIYAAKCRSCHGYMGQADTDYARERNIDVPSLVREDWPYQNILAVRRVIFIGHADGMPTFGVAGITPREIDAVAYYLMEVLRPEVLGGTQ
jgi:mono/diheme cytochrome c family protein